VGLNPLGFMGCETTPNNSVVVPKSDQTILHPLVYGLHTWDFSHSSAVAHNAQIADFLCKAQISSDSGI